MKKYLIAGVLIAVVVIGFIIYVIFSNKSSSDKVNNKVELNEPLIPEKKGERSIDTSGWERRSAENIELSLPPGWNAQKFKVNENGYAVEIKPEGKGTDDAFPRIDIMVLPYESEKQIEDLAYQVESFGFKRSSAIFFGISAIKLSMTLPGKAFAAGNPEKKDVVKDLFIFKKNDRVYQVDYAYYIDQDMDKTQDTIKGIFSTLILN